MPCAVFGAYAFLPLSEGRQNQHKDTTAWIVLNYHPFPSLAGTGDSKLLLLMLSDKFLTTDTKISCTICYSSSVSFSMADGKSAPVHSFAGRGINTYKKKET